MIELQGAIADLASAVKSKIYGSSAKADPIPDPIDGAPVCREELEELFSLQETQSLEENETDKLRESERLERESMSLIRNALYAD